MVFVKCKNVEDLKEHCRKEYNIYVSEKGDNFFFLSNVETIVEQCDFDLMIEEMLKNHRKNTDICMRVYTDFREISTSKESVLQELRETEEFLRQQPGENYWVIQMKEGKEKYKGLLLWTEYLDKSGQKQEFLYIGEHQ